MKNTCVIEVITDGSVRKPHELVENVIVRIEDCYFPVDFLVVDMKMTKELSQAPIILGRPLLATAKAVIDWGKGEIILKVGEHTVKVDSNKLMKYLHELPRTWAPSISSTTRTLTPA